MNDREAGICILEPVVNEAVYAAGLVLARVNLSTLGIASELIDDLPPRLPGRRHARNRRLYLQREINRKVAALIKTAWVFT